MFVKPIPLVLRANTVPLPELPPRDVVPYKVLPDNIKLADGSEPSASLILSGSTLYGTTSRGGSSGSGTVFALSTNGMGFTNIYSFTLISGPLPQTNSDGAYPGAGLVLSGNTLYGTAANGGTASYGTIFKVNTDGTGFTNLHTFTGGAEGAYPSSNLMLCGDTLYGTTYGITVGGG